jgi:Flp pilus assembly protein TadG
MIMRRPIGKVEPRRGVAAAELAIVLPFLMLMFGVAIDFCRVFYTSQTVQNCAYAGALYASSTVSPRPDVSAPSQAAQDAALAEGVSLNPPLSAANISTSISNGMATTTVTYNFSFIMPLMGNSITITRSVKMQVLPQGPYWGNGQ